MSTPISDTTVPARFWHALGDGRVQCDLCPRYCKLHEGQRGLCFVRKMDAQQMWLTTYGKSSGFCIDPIEKKPLNHFYPGSSVLSFGTAGCNLNCKFCQNWDISKSRKVDTLSQSASPTALAKTAAHHGCKSIAYTYNDPVIFLEYATDVAEAAHHIGVNNVAVTAGYINEAALPAFFRHMDAANIDLKSFNETFYRKICGGHLDNVLATLEYVRQETTVWLEITTLLIPGENDGSKEIETLSQWIAEHLGKNTPLHFTAFHPDWKMQKTPATPATTVINARKIALDNGLEYVYTGNIQDTQGSTTYCPECQHAVIRRSGYQLLAWNLSQDACHWCGHHIPGVFSDNPESWGNKRIPIQVR